MKQAARPNSPLKGHDKTVQYLQHLGRIHILLFFFSDSFLPCLVNSILSEDARHAFA